MKWIREKHIVYSIRETGTLSRPLSLFSHVQGQLYPGILKHFFWKYTPRPRWPTVYNYVVHFCFDKRWSLSDFGLWGCCKFDNYAVQYVAFTIHTGRCFVVWSKWSTTVLVLVVFVAGRCTVLYGDRGSLRVARVLLLPCGQLRTSCDLCSFCSPPTHIGCTARVLMFQRPRRWDC